MGGGTGGGAPGLQVFKGPKEACGACQDGVTPADALSRYERISWSQDVRGITGKGVKLKLCAECHGDGGWIPVPYRPRNSLW